MWKLLSTDFKYNTLFISFAYLFCLICFMAIWFGVKYEHNRIPLFMLIILVSTLMVHLTVEGISSKEQRNRFHIFLPVPSIEVHAIRLLRPFLTWLSIGALLFLTHGIVQSFSANPLAIPSAEQLLSVNGLVLTVSAAYLLNIDMKIAFPKNHFRVPIFITWITVYVAALLPFFILMDFLGAFGQDTPLQGTILHILSSMWGSITLNLIGLIFAMASVLIYIHGKSWCNL